VPKELNHLAAIWHVYAGRGFEFYEVKNKKNVIIFQRENGNTFTLFYHFFCEKSSKRAK